MASDGFQPRAPTDRQLALIRELLEERGFIDQAAATADQPAPGSDPSRTPPSSSAPSSTGPTSGVPGGGIATTAGDTTHLFERVLVAWTWDGTRWSREDDRTDETPADREADWMQALEERGRRAD